MDAIANHIWQSTLFAVVAGLAAMMCRTNSASVRYWIWFAAALGGCLIGIRLRPLFGLSRD